ncbi:heme-binding domain-containing protein [Fulvivirga sedimenti]|uniref:Heme-binding domain-containing protein n=1 Tax=Fulvivirga sedimenti TaxID=2879465 RepID=A0A9X1L131_9BACT|nr:heme-binding domain-containing protein [Fulvivirga sedimenti]MCA6075324.1 heme-binding domain-containing protein [Fulvivirga sedimenti]MCA6076501.1 heme-binding domain-containing protein [Fulvivirga sedimenti]MCA6077629.1 heme-binding domain-containing protein [Fulvivirga sedimenti]
MIRKILLVLLVALIVIQFIPIDTDVPEVEASKDFIAMTNPPQEVSIILKQACYDCHSYETVYPWYSNIAPVKFWLKDHINDGRKHLNFSEWGNYETKRQNHKLEELMEEVGEGEMPLDSYTWTHEEARLTQDQVNSLVSWVKNGPFISTK